MSKDNYISRLMNYFRLPKVSWQANHTAYLKAHKNYVPYFQDFVHREPNQGSLLGLILHGVAMVYALDRNCENLVRAVSRLKTNLIMLWFYFKHPSTRPKSCTESALLPVPATLLWTALTTCLGKAWAVLRRSDRPTPNTSQLWWLLAMKFKTVSVCEG